MITVYRLGVEWTSSQYWLDCKVLVTGASGFLGRAVCELLAEAGAEVHGTWRSRLPDPGIHAHHAVLPADAVELVSKIRPRRIFHLASPIDHDTGIDAWQRLRSGIFDSTIAIARAAASNGARLIHIGTCAEYGNLVPPFEETMQCMPCNAYGGLKLAATQTILSMVRTGKLDAVVLRPFRAHGPHDHQSLVSEACRAALARRPLEITAGNQIREWNSVYEIAEGIISAGAHPEVGGTILNIGGGPRASVRTIAELIFRLAEAPQDLIEIGARGERPGDVSNLWSNSKRARDLFQLQAPAPLDASLTDTLEWYRTHPLSENTE